MQSDELSLAARAAWLSYVGNQTQEEIAGRLGVSRVKVNRLIGQAVRAGLVHVYVEGTAAECIALEENIAIRWGLEFCAVAPTVEDVSLPLATLAAAGGHWLHRVLETGRAIAAVLASGLLTGLITDEATAREVVAFDSGAVSPGAVHPTKATTGSAGHA